MEEIRKRIQDGIKVQQALAEQAADPIRKVAIALADALSAGRTVYLLGDPDNLLTAQHIAATFVGRQDTDRKALPVIAFPVDGSLLALVGNDYGFEHVYLRQINAFVEKGDVVCALTTTGEEKPLRDALQRAREIGAQTVIVAGGADGGVKGFAHHTIPIPSKDPHRTQEAILIIGHTLYNAVLRMLFGRERIGGVKNLIRFSCPNCGEKIYSDERFTGRKGACPSCHAPIVVPNLKAEKVEVPRMEAAEKKGEKRIHMRYNVQDCILQYSKKSFFDAAPTNFNHYPLENLSQGGLQFMITYVVQGGGQAPQCDVAVDDEIWLSIDLPAFIEPIVARGCVRRVIAVPERQSFRIGVAFTELKDVDREKLRKISENVVLRNIRRSQGMY